MNKTKKHITISDMVLDLGCGTGLISNEMAGYVKKIHAVDTSSKMIGITEEKAKERNIVNVDYAHSTIFDKRYMCGSFDVIFVFHVLHLLEDEHRVFRRMNELLKPGGLLISVTPCMGEKLWLRTMLSFVSKIGLVPKIRSYKIEYLVRTIENGNFSIVETDCLKKKSQEYFIVARKV